MTLGEDWCLVFLKDTVTKCTQVRALLPADEQKFHCSVAPGASMMPKGEREIGDSLQIIKPNMLVGAPKITSYMPSP